MKYWKTKRGNLVGGIISMFIFITPFIVLLIINDVYALIYMLTIIVHDWNRNFSDKLTKYLKEL